MLAIVNDDLLELSIADSLKRIADHRERLCQVRRVVSFSSWLAQFGEFRRCDYYLKVVRWLSSFWVNCDLAGPARCVVMGAPLDVK